MTTQVNKELENIIKHDINYVILVSNIFGYKILNETINSMNKHHKDFIRVYNKCKKDINASLKEELLQLKQEFELDDIKQLSNKQTLKNGITIYDVEDSKEGQKAMREIINTHFGKDSSPWYLLQADEEGKLTTASWEYWEYYGKTKKQVAFKNGKLIAFSANDSRKVVWWDKQDESHKEIPVIGKIEGDELGRSGTALYDNKGELVRTEGLYRGNKENGTYEEWDENGQLRRRENYKDGELDGLQEEWDENGKLLYRANYKNGEKDGVWEYYYENGQLRKRENYKNGEEDGLREWWYKNGQLQRRANCKNGELDGVQEYWYENGQLRRRENYKNGELDGVQEEWYENGQLNYRVNYKDGKWNGVQEYWYDNGKLLYRENYKDEKESATSSAI